MKAKKCETCVNCIKNRIDGHERVKYTCLEELSNDLFVEECCKYDAGQYSEIEKDEMYDVALIRWGNKVKRDNWDYYYGDWRV